MDQELGRNVQKLVESRCNLEIELLNIHKYIQEVIENNKPETLEIHIGLGSQVRVKQSQGLPVNGKKELLLAKLRTEEIERQNEASMRLLEIKQRLEEG